ncbi:hypothetical protein AgCh_013768 [Apium graveolens]
METCFGLLRRELELCEDDSILKFLLECAEQLPHKIPLYGTVVGLLNLENDGLVKKIVETIHTNLQGALDDGNCSRIRILMRFLTVLMCCKVVQPTALLVVFETLLSSAATLVDEEKGISSWQACADFYITCILSCLPWGGSELIEDLQPIDRFVVEEYLLDVLLFLNGCRKECASYMVGLPVPFRYEYLMAETIFTQQGSEDTGEELGGVEGSPGPRQLWNGLQALFLKDCPYAYYIHCLAHQLQLALVVAIREVPQIHTFFQNMVFIINAVTSSSKRHDELQANQIAEIEHLKEIEEIQTGKGLNQIGTLQRPGDTRWSSHFTAICSLIRMYGATHSVLIDVAAQGTTFSQRDMNAPYFDVLKSLRRQGKQKQMVTMEHHYRVEIFTAAIDQQLQELNNRFSEQMTELLILSASLNPRDGCRSFNIENICKLAEKFYPEVFLGDEKIHLQCELQHYGLDVPVHPDLKNLSTLGDLCHGLVTTGKADMYPLVDRLLRLVLTLPASTATSERVFSAMKIVKTSLRNRMEDEFLRDYLIVYIEKEIAETISAEEIIDSFYLIKERRAHLK